MTRSYLPAIGTVILALLISCSGTSAQNQPDITMVPVTPAIPEVDRDRMGCEAARQAYNEQGCDKSVNVSDECKSIASDLSKCERAAVPHVVVPALNGPAR